jgi:predicted dienelactone hydrolase
MCKRLLFLLLLLPVQYAFTQITTMVNIGERTLHYKDSSRNRPVITEVWYPTSDTLQNSDKAFSPFIRNYTVRNGILPQDKLPLVVISHGTGGGRLTLEWLAQALVQKGFIVAAVDHWGNTYDNKIPIEFLKPWERPQDVSFAITSLLHDTAFKTVIDEQRMGAAGFSYGGYTVIALAGAQLDFATLIHYYKTTGKKEMDIPELPGIRQYLEEYDDTLMATAQHQPPLKDSRIKAFFAISPALGSGFTNIAQFKDIRKPVFIAGSQSDSIAPVKSNALHYHTMIKHSGYYEFPGKTGHYVMLNEAMEDLKKSDPLIFADSPSVNRHGVHLEVDSLAVKFFKDNL